jgi:23S rRNA pseudouridine1911/1915/1917 synthase
MQWNTTDADRGLALAKFLKTHLAEQPWRVVKDAIASGKVTVNGQQVTDPGVRLTSGQAVSLNMSAPRLNTPAAIVRQSVRVVFEDPSIIVVDKPSGLSSVPYDGEIMDTVVDSVRRHWKQTAISRQMLRIVHRIDRATSGLLVLARSAAAEKGLAKLFRAHNIEREYLCVAHGVVTPGRIESRLVHDRGDGLRGSTIQPNQGKVAVTHVSALETMPGDAATLCAVRLETGKTHQIRIHLAERGHPLLGEQVYIRDFERDGAQVLPCPRLLLHAYTLGFMHPITNRWMRWTAPLPEDFEAELTRLRAPPPPPRAGE